MESKYAYENMAGTDKTRTAQVEDELQRLEKQLAECHIVFEDLTSRLSPIIRNEPSETKGGEVGRPTPVLVPLAERIRHLTTRLEALSLNARNLITRIEL
jgi:isochorismate synthase EntC